MIATSSSNRGRAMNSRFTSTNIAARRLINRGLRAPHRRIQGTIGDRGLPSNTMDDRIHISSGVRNLSHSNEHRHMPRRIIPVTRRQTSKNALLSRNQRYVNNRMKPRSLLPSMYKKQTVRNSHITDLHHTSIDIEPKFTSINDRNTYRRRQSVKQHRMSGKSGYGSSRRRSRSPVSLHTKCKIDDKCLDRDKPSLIPPPQPFPISNSLKEDNSSLDNYSVRRSTREAIYGKRDQTLSGHRIVRQASDSKSRMGSENLHKRRSLLMVDESQDSAGNRTVEGQHREFLSPSNQFERSRPVVSQLHKHHSPRSQSVVSRSTEHQSSQNRKTVLQSHEYQSPLSQTVVPVSASHNEVSIPVHRSDEHKPITSSSVASQSTELKPISSGPVDNKSSNHQSTRIRLVMPRSTEHQSSRTKPVHQSEGHQSVRHRPVYKSAEHRLVRSRPVNKSVRSRLDHQSVRSRHVHQSAEHQSVRSRPVLQSARHESVRSRPVHQSAEHQSARSRPVHQSNEHQSDRSRPVHLSNEHPSGRTINLRSAETRIVGNRGGPNRYVDSRLVFRSDNHRYVDSRNVNSRPAEDRFVKSHMASRYPVGHQSVKDNTVLTESVEHRSVPQRCVDHRSSLLIDNSVLPRRNSLLTKSLDSNFHRFHQSNINSNQPLDICSQDISPSNQLSNVNSFRDSVHSSKPNFGSSNHKRIDIRESDRLVDQRSNIQELRQFDQPRNTRNEEHYSIHNPNRMSVNQTFDDNLLDSLNQSNRLNSSSHDASRQNMRYFSGQNYNEINHTRRSNNFRNQ